MKKVLFIGSHCDDIELGCGGTIHKFKKKWDITCTTFSKSIVFNQFPNLFEISQKALESLGAFNTIYYDYPTCFFHENRQKIWEDLTRLEKKKFDMVFCNNFDEHQDHAIIAKEVTRVFRKSSLVYYPIYRSDRNFESNIYIKLSKVDVNAKLDALGLYEMHKDKNYFNKKNIIATLRYNGVYFESKYAEAFCVNKIIIN